MIGKQMTHFVRLPLKALTFLAGAVAATAVAAAPIGDTSPTQDCFSNAALEHSIEYAQCSAFPIQLRDPCILQAEQHYAAADAACGAAQRAIPAKQNIDPAFLRRMRY